MFNNSIICAWHNFQLNIQQNDYFRFGRVPSLETLTAIRKGEELFSHYKVNNLRYKNNDSNHNTIKFSSYLTFNPHLRFQYDSALAPNWYQEAWNRFTHPEEYQDDE